jgi:glycosyltransferase involved in cell wall biosynthesis
MMVSVIIPAYNAGRFISATLNSAILQTHKNIEIIVVDDGSSDGTVALVEKFQRADERILLYRQSHFGVAAARNLGVQSSHGEFIAFLDADDVWHPTKIRKQHVLLASAAEDVGLVYSYSRMIDSEGFIQGRTGVCLPKRGSVFEYLLIDNFIGNGSAALVRRTCLPEPEPFDASLQGNTDTYFYLLIAAKYKVEVVPEFLVGYRWNTGQNVSSDLQKQIQSHENMIDKLRTHFPKLSTRALRWSRAGFYLSHAQTLFKKKRYKDAFGLFWYEVISMPDYFLSPLFCRAFLLASKWMFRKLLRVKNTRKYFLDADVTV